MFRPVHPMRFYLSCLVLGLCLGALADLIIRSIVP